MKKIFHKHLIIGGGLTADAAVNGIQETEPGADIGILCSEPHPPYNRPPLSKSLWKGKREGVIWRQTEHKQVSLYLGRRAERIERKAKQVVDTEGGVYRYEKLLIATGGSPRQLPDGNPDIVYFRTLDDYRQLRASLTEGSHAVIIGGGFIGSELASSLPNIGIKVTLIFPESGICGRMLPSELSESLNGLFEENGVTVMAGESVSKVVDRRVILESGKKIEGDIVIAGLGILPASALAQDSGLETRDGIVVNACGQTSDSNIYAAGDVACFPSTLTGGYCRFEHEDHAYTMGELVGRNMAGATEPYAHIPCFYSEFFGIHYEALGQLDPAMETLAIWDDPNRKGIIYCLEGDTPKGILFWGVAGLLEQGRELLRTGSPIDRDAPPTWHGPVI